MNVDETNHLESIVTTMFYQRVDVKTAAAIENSKREVKPKQSKKKEPEPEDIDEEVVENKQYTLRDRSNIKPPADRSFGMFANIIERYENEKNKEGVVQKKRVRKPYKPIAIPKFVGKTRNPLQMIQSNRNIGFSYNRDFKCYVFNGTHRMSGSISSTKKWYYSTFDLNLCKKKRPKGSKGTRSRDQKADDSENVHDQRKDDDEDNEMKAPASTENQPVARSRGQSPFALVVSRHLGPARDGRNGRFRGRASACRRNDS